ncbi:MAG: tRNA glutamyl-Q(34) synthetase GluQRS [Brevundimonas sp.]|uniref:tRNA glutamyl-Q(34) synthetase GluQRS n=1 Tax=Brevundimonas sp. TaxID=1871086 RepID=UPI0027631232|nr:tRNA glutamyl-Q(34) synthetase GluQRS [Brevundimonas sp.]MDP3400326.1 tRNA glutamyl-Q(34) synthetase GluQRS [Brevundimonas sp.]MDZ4108256.1 tRNA glutamyl-Q(34) synthetase GluQRS [Brevundimonas sp.]
MTLVTRFAPSPTGLLHKGHAFSALTAWTAAREAGGRFLLRIEDTDFTRCRPEYTEAVCEDLAWLGLDWETPVRHQSDHRAEYDRALETLREQGLLYRCFRTRNERLALAGVAPHADDPADPAAFTGGPHSPDEEARRLEAGEAFAWRLSLDRARAQLGALSRLTWVEEGVDPGTHSARPGALGDMVMGRKDIGAGYVIASVIDDAAQGITHVIRGEDLIPMTSIQRVLQALLQLPTPEYRHHPLLLDETGKRFAKRDGAVTLAQIRAGGTSPADLRARMGFPD